MFVYRNIHEMKSRNTTESRKDDEQCQLITTVFLSAKDVVLLDHIQ